MQEQNMRPIEDILASGAIITACRSRGDGVFTPYRPNRKDLGIFDYDNRRGFWDSYNILRDLRNGKGDPEGYGKGEMFPLFRFEAGPAGLLVLDLDRGHKDEADGVQSLYKLLKGKIYPQYLKDIENGSHPCYVETPSGGIHLYFKLKSTTKYRRNDFKNGVEAFYYGSLITAPGSVKNGVPYKLYGSVSDAPLAPKAILSLLKKPYNYRKYGKKVAARSPNKSLQELADQKLAHGSFSGRNDLCFKIASSASFLNHSREAIIRFLAFWDYTASLPEDEIETTVNSALSYVAKEQR